MSCRTCRRGEVRAAVADVADEERLAALREARRDERRPHPVQLRVGLGALVDADVRELHAGEEAVLVVAPHGVELVRPGRLLIPAGQPEELGHLLDREPRRDLPGRVAAHAVGDAVELLLGQEQVGVLVVRPLPSDVRDARVLRPW